MTTGGDYTNAVGVWGFLQVFPPAARGPLAAKLGFAPTVPEFVAAWKLFGLRQAKLQGIACSYNSKANAVLVWRTSQPGYGNVYDNLLSHADDVVDDHDVLVCGDPAYVTNRLCEDARAVNAAVQIGYDGDDALDCASGAAVDVLVEAKGDAQDCAETAVADAGAVGVSTAVATRVDQPVAAVGSDRAFCDPAPADVVGGLALGSVLRVGDTYVPLAQGLDVAGYSRSVPIDGPGVLVVCGEETHLPGVRAALDGRGAVCSLPDVLAGRRADHVVWLGGSGAADGDRDICHGVLLAMLAARVSFTTYVHSDAEIRTIVDDHVFWPDGWCYRAMRRSDGTPVPDLGPWPTVAMLVEAGVDSGGLDKLKPAGVGRWHYAADCQHRGVSDRVKSSRDIGGALPLGEVVGAESGMAALLVQACGGLFSEEDAVRAGVGLAACAAAMLPGADKERLRVLAAVGDSVLTAVLATEAACRETTVQELQEWRSYVTSNSQLAARFADSPFPPAFHWVGGRQSLMSRVGADAMEALIGVAFMAGGVASAARLISFVGILPPDLLGRPKVRDRLGW